MSGKVFSEPLAPVKIGEWWFTAKAASFGGVLAWCAKTPDLCGGPMRMSWDFVVHFTFAETVEQAFCKLKTELGEV